MNDDPTYLKRLLSYFQNRKIVAILLAFGITVIAISKFTDAVDNIYNTIIKWTKEKDVAQQPRDVSGLDTSLTSSGGQEAHAVKIFQVAVFSIPNGAKIMIGDSFYGLTNRTIDLTAGFHEITIMKEGYEEYRDKIKIPQQDVVTVELDRLAK
jgi:hypothetical protein